MTQQAKHTPLVESLLEVVFAGRASRGALTMLHFQFLNDLFWFGAGAYLVYRLDRTVFLTGKGKP